MMKNPRSVVTFYGFGRARAQIMDSSLQDPCAESWVRAKEALTLEQAIRLSFVPAYHWGLTRTWAFAHGNFGGRDCFQSRYYRRPNRGAS